MEPMEPPWIHYCKHFLFSVRLLILQLVFKVWLKQPKFCVHKLILTPITSIQVYMTTMQHQITIKGGNKRPDQ